MYKCIENDIKIHNDNFKRASERMKTIKLRSTAQSFFPLIRSTLTYIFLFCFHYWNQ